MDFLRKVSSDYLKFVKLKLQQNLPYSIKDLYYILGAEKSKKSAENLTDISDKLLPVFYTHPSGLKKNCTIFGITSGTVDHTVWFFSFEDSLSEVKECLEKTKLIEWENVLFVTVHREQIDPVLDYVASINYTIEYNENASYFWLSKEEASKFDVKIPNGMIVESLKEEDTEICNSIWKYRSEGSEAFVRSLILLNGGYGLRDKATRELLACAFINDHLATGLLNTVEHARGKRYGELMAKLIALKIAKDLDLNPTCYINDLNTPSIRLFEKIGYKRIGSSNWIAINNRKNSGFL